VGDETLLLPFTRSYMCCRHRRIEAVMNQPMPGRFPERKITQRYPLANYNRAKYGWPF